MKNARDIPASWKLTYEEVSNGVYKMRLTWERGPFVETSGTDFEGLRAWCIESARNIEDQLRRKDLST
ncbi:hypothetical protein [Hymenobacter arizonensis]|uniref:Uncharacterized protein n=1 Tax=Hymenobacter arizonensis TaxID=1227077 RepID=A0A1I6BCV1_HYMAR|nr:hypothetical protein [Hymenobacter arizonensis]SFQ78773.1 hypothetical protein SAMN04515668_4360 [Hymenobacter arizonensis]